MKTAFLAVAGVILFACSARAEKIVSDRTMEDIKESESAALTQWKAESGSAGNRFKNGTYSDVNGAAWKYGMSFPAKAEPGKKYPLFIGNCGWALNPAASQEKYPCFTMNVYAPASVFTPDPKTGYKADHDYKSVWAAAIKAVIDKVVAENPAVDPSRVCIEGASKFGALCWISAYNYPDTYAAIVPSVGGTDVSKALVIAERKIGIWMYYGELDGGPADPIIRKKPFGRGHPGIYGALREAGYDPMMTVYTHGDHHEYGFSDSAKNPKWDDFTQLKKWLFAEKKPAMDWPVISGNVSVLATAGQPFTYKIVASNEPKSFGAVITIEHAEDKNGVLAKPPSDLPKGLTLDAKTGVLSGAPAEPGRFFIRITATNDKGVGMSTLFLTVKDK